LLTVAEVLTQGVSTLPRPMNDEEFYTGYRERLESKLRYKNTQIARTERLLQTLPQDQDRHLLPCWNSRSVIAMRSRANSTNCTAFWINIKNPAPANSTSSGFRGKSKKEINSCNRV
jgi:hypothetical protein